jgi:uncharacterized protein (DUF952 family)
MLIYHITAESEWEKAKVTGYYTTPSLELEGFIHASNSEQLVVTANRYFNGRTDLVILKIVTEKVEPEVRLDPVTSYSEPQEFPHIYGPLNLDAVIEVIDFKPDADGSFSMPDQRTRQF